MHTIIFLFSMIYNIFVLCYSCYSIELFYSFSYAYVSEFNNIPLTYHGLDTDSTVCLSTQGNENVNTSEATGSNNTGIYSGYDTTTGGNTNLNMNQGDVRHCEATNNNHA